MATLGINIYVCLGDTIIAGTRSNEIQTSVDTIEISSPTSGIWKQHKNIRKDWSLSTSFLCLNNADVQKLLQIGNTYTIQVVGQEGSSAEELLSGTAILTSCKITASVANLVQGSFVFDGNGELTSDQPVPPTPQNPEIAWSAASASATIGGTNTFPTLSNPHSLPITYSSSDTSVATVDSSGVVTLLAAGSANISASFAGSAEYYASTVSYALAVEAALPYDAEVEYLESTGTQYISLPLNVSAGDSLQIDIEFKVTSESTAYPLFGYNKQFHASRNSSSVLSSNIGENTANGGIGYTEGSKCSIMLSTEGIRSASGTYKSLSRAITSEFSSVGIFKAITHRYNSKFAFYSCKWTHNGTLVYDLIPVRIETTGYLYDTISGQLYGNAGTGNFVLGPDKN